MKKRCVVWRRLLLPVLAAAVAATPSFSFAAEKAASKPKASVPAKAKSKSAPKAKTSPAAEKSPGKLPWGLRDHFDIKVNNTTLVYGVDNAEWNIEVEGLGTAVDDARVKVMLTNGTTIESSGFENGDASRKAFTGDFGDGMAYTVALPAKNGVGLRHSIANYKQRPFYMVCLEVTNTSASPIEIASISPVVFAGGGIRFFDSPESSCSFRHFEQRGSSPVFDPKAPVALALFHNRSRDFSLAIGTLPGAARADVKLAKKDGAYYGEVVCAFDPPVTLAPGATIAANPVWLSFAEPKPAKIDLFYSWAQSALPKTTSSSEACPEKWVTVRDDQTLDDLSKALRQWSGAGVTSALIPASWQASPGALEGDGSRYPKNMASAVKRLGSSARASDETVAPAPKQPKKSFNAPKWLSAIGLGKTGETAAPAQAEHAAAPAETAAEEYAPAKAAFGATVAIGVTVDPLKVQGGSDAWAVTGSDNVRYVNPAVPEGKAYAVERMRQLARCGFQFFAIPPSTLPKDVLQKFNLTRAQADALAFAILGEAVAGKPVVPASTATLTGDVNAWLDVCAGSSRFKEFEMDVAPVRMDVSGIDKVGEDLMTAMMFCGAPIEFVGAPSSGVREAVARTFPKPQVWARALDAASPAPKLWMVQPKCTDEDAYGAAVVMFAGASAWDAAWYGFETDKPVRLWRADNGSVAEVKGAVPAAQTLTALGVTQTLPRPVLLAVTPGPGFSLHEIDRAKWDEAGGVLSGSLRGNGKDSAAYIVVPDAWKLESGKIGDRSLGVKDGSSLIALNIDRGKSTAFSAKFVRR